MLSMTMGVEQKNQTSVSGIGHQVLFESVIEIVSGQIARAGQSNRSQAFEYEAGAVEPRRIVATPSIGRAEIRQRGAY